MNNSVTGLTGWIVCCWQLLLSHPACGWPTSSMFSKLLVFLNTARDFYSSHTHFISTLSPLSLPPSLIMWLLALTISNVQVIHECQLFFEKKGEHKSHRCIAKAKIYKNVVAMPPQCFCTPLCSLISLYIAAALRLIQMCLCVVWSH